MTSRDVARCKRCVLPTSFPGIRFDAAGICQYCRESDSESIDAQAELKLQLNEATDTAKGNGAQYQCIVAYSGGKDSTYVLQQLVSEVGLRCLAVTVDNDFLSAAAIENCRRVASALDIDHIFFKPSSLFMRNMYRKSVEGNVNAPAAIKRASDVCNSCINLINNVMIRFAIQNGASLIAGGYLGGQVPKDAAVMELSLVNLVRTRTPMLSRYETAFGARARDYFALPPGAEAAEALTVINPMLAVDFAEEQIIERIKQLGWITPQDTGIHSSNCRLNDLGIHLHKKKYGFHPYTFELAELVRRGKMDRDQAITKLETEPPADVIADVAKDLGVNSN